MSKLHIIADKAPYPQNLADEHFHIKARIADLKRDLKKIEDKLYATGQPVIEGNFARVTVSEVQPSWVIDYKEAATTLLKPEQVSKFTKLRSGSVRVVSKARQGTDKVA